MMEKIRNALRELGVDTYTVHETATQSVEAFYVRKRLDLKRRTDLTEYEVTVFRPLEREGRALLGSAAVPVYPDTAGNKHIPTGGTTGQILEYGGSSGTAKWVTPPQIAQDSEITQMLTEVFGE